MARVVRREINIGWDELQKRIDDLDKYVLQAGWFDSAKYDEKTPVAAIAAIQEFGSASGRIPPRPFLRPVVENGRSKWKDFFRDGAKRYLKGEIELDTLLEILGIDIAGDIRQSIASVSTPPLSEVTLALRKHKRQGKKISGKFVGAVAQAIEDGETGPGELGDSSGADKKPLVFDAIMLNTVTHIVKKG